MKKLTIVLILMLISSMIMGQCQLYKEKDPFTGIENISTSNDRLGFIGKNGQVNFMLSMIFDKDTTLRLSIGINRFTIRCIDSTSKVLIKIGENVVTFKLSGKRHCGTKLQEYLPISLDTFKVMSDAIITAIRVYYTTEFEDFAIDQDNKMFFIHNYVCLSNNYPAYFHKTE